MNSKNQSKRPNAQPGGYTFWGRWVLVTGIGAGVGWGLGLGLLSRLSMSNLADHLDDLTRMYPLFVGVRSYILVVVVAVGLTFFGASVAWGQWLVLRRHMHEAADWLTFNVFGWMIAGALSGTLFAATTMLIDWVEKVMWDYWNSLLSVLVSAVVGGIWLIMIGSVIGIMQWFVLRQRVRQAGWWVPAGILSWVAGGIAGLLVREWLLPEIVGGLLVGVIAVAEAVRWFVVHKQARKFGWWVLLCLLIGIAGILVGTIAEAATEGAFLSGTAAGIVAGAVSGRVLIGLLRQPVTGTDSE